MGTLDIREELMITVAVIAAFASACATLVVDPGMLIEWPVVLLLVYAGAVLGLAILMNRRIRRVKENRYKWVRICCMYRQGLRERIAHGEFRVTREYMDAMDRMDANVRRDAERFQQWEAEKKKRQSLADAMPE